MSSLTSPKRGDEKLVNSERHDKNTDKVVNQLVVQVMLLERGSLIHTTMVKEGQAAQRVVNSFSSNQTVECLLGDFEKPAMVRSQRILG